MRTIVGVALMLVTAGCGGAAGRPAPAAPVPDEAGAIVEARGLAGEIELGLLHGDATGLAPLCATDLAAFGPRVGDDRRPRSDTLMALGAALPGKRHKVKIRDLQIDSADDARSAWLTELVELDGRRHAVTAVVAEVDGMWLVTAVMVGALVPERALREPGEPLPRLASSTAAPVPGAGNRRAADEPVAAFVRAVADVDARLEQLDGERTVVMGPGERAVWRGEKAIRKAWHKGGPRWTLTGDAQAGATPDGQLVWVVANAVTVEPSGSGRPRRLFAIYRRADRDAPPPPRAPGRGHKLVERPVGAPSAWRLVVLHEGVTR